MIERTYRVNDVVRTEFLRLPLTLLANPKYKQMSLEAKFIYSLLLNRMTLSQRNDWINEDNEVYLIYTREEAATTLNISYKKSIAAFKELIQNGLLYEHRQGLGAPNLLYVLKAELTDDEATEFGENFDGKNDENTEKEPANPVNKQMCQNGISRTAEMAHQELPKQHIKVCQNGTSRTADTTGQDMPERHTSNINNKKTDISYIENSQSINLSGRAKTKMTDEQNDIDAEILQRIIDRCEFNLFKKDVRIMFRTAIERLYYSETLKVGDARLPQIKVRSYLNLLTTEILMEVLETMRKNEDRIKNPTAYLMSTIINTICEQESDLILNLPSYYVGEDDFYVSIDDEEGDEYDGTGFEFGSEETYGVFRPIRGAP